MALPCVAAARSPCGGLGGAVRACPTLAGRRVSSLAASARLAAWIWRVIWAISGASRCSSLGRCVSAVGHAADSATEKRHPPAEPSRCPPASRGISEIPSCRLPTHSSSCPPPPVPARPRTSCLRRCSTSEVKARSVPRDENPAVVGMPPPLPPLTAAPASSVPSPHPPPVRPPAPPLSGGPPPLGPFPGPPSPFSAPSDPRLARTSRFAARYARRWGRVPPHASSWQQRGTRAASHTSTSTHNTNAPSAIL